MLTYQLLRERYAVLKKSHNELFNELVRTDKERKYLNQQLEQALKDYDETLQELERYKHYAKVTGIEELLKKTENLEIENKELKEKYEQDR